MCQFFYYILFVYFFVQVEKKEINIIENFIEVLICSLVINSLKYKVFNLSYLIFLQSFESEVMFYKDFFFNRVYGLFENFKIVIEKLL